MRKIPVMAAALLLAACASPDSRYFTLSTVAPAGMPAPDRPLFHLSVVKLADLYDRPQMVTRTGPQSVEIDEYARWAEPLERMTARTLAQDIALRRPHGPGPLPGAADQPRLQVAVDEFVTDRASGRAKLSGNWKIVEASGAVHGAPFSYTEPVTSSDPAATAAAMSALLGRLADEIDKN